ncbi:DUF1616 domain-containing protein [Chloroflexota bacterium]
MKIKMGSGLWPLNLLVIALIITIVFSSSEVLRVILALPFALFFPGYALVLTLFPRREGIDSIERVALSLGSSMAVTLLIGLSLNYTGLGITLESTLYSITSFILVMSIIAWLRYRRLPREQRFNIEFQLRVPGWRGNVWDRTLLVALVISVTGAFVALGYAVATPTAGEKLTEFYILGQEGQVADYPRELVVEEEGKVVVGIVNHEHETMTYRVDVLVNGVEDTGVGPVVLGHQEKWEEELSFIPRKAGEHQKVEFLLYKQGQTEAYRALHLWVDITQ